MFSGCQKNLSNATYSFLVQYDKMKFFKGGLSSPSVRITVTMTTIRFDYNEEKVLCDEFSVMGFSFLFCITLADFFFFFKENLSSINIHEIGSVTMVTT